MNEPQWAVVGDTFPVGCQYSKNIVYSQEFVANPDYNHSEYSNKYGMYTPHCGLDNIHMSWGHDEYLYNITRDYLPKEALFIIRYHSFYSAHTAGDYTHLMNESDHEMMKHLKEFNKYDLYSKTDDASMWASKESQEYQKLKQDIELKTRSTELQKD